MKCFYIIVVQNTNVRDRVLKKLKNNESLETSFIFQIHDIMVLSLYNLKTLLIKISGRFEVEP